MNLKQLRKVMDATDSRLRQLHKSLEIWEQRLAQNPKWLGRCAELVCQNLKEGSFRLGSARINEWRDDKNPEDCQLQDEMIRYDR